MTSTIGVTLISETTGGALGNFISSSSQKYRARTNLFFNQQQAWSGLPPLQPAIQPEFCSAAYLVAPATFWVRFKK